MPTFSAKKPDTPSQIISPEPQPFNYQTKILGVAPKPAFQQPIHLCSRFYGALQPPLFLSCVIYTIIQTIVKIKSQFKLKLHSSPK